MNRCICLLNPSQPPNRRSPCARSSLCYCLLLPATCCFQQMEHCQSEMSMHACKQTAMTVCRQQSELCLRKPSAPTDAWQQALQLSHVTSHQYLTHAVRIEVVAGLVHKGLHAPASLSAHRADASPGFDCRCTHGPSGFTGSIRCSMHSAP